MDLNGEIIYAINCFDDDHGLQGIRNVVIRDVEFIADHTLEIEGYSTTSDTGNLLVMHLQIDFLPTMMSSMNSDAPDAAELRAMCIHSAELKGIFTRYKYYG